MAKNKYAVPKHAITEKGLKRLLKDAAKNHSSMSDWANSNNITFQSVSAFMRKVEGAGLKIPAALGYRPQLVFIPLDAELISTPNPPRRVAQKPTSKVDHTRAPVEKKTIKPQDDRKETKKRLKKLKR
jgi:hypothetical protein